MDIGLLVFRIGIGLIMAFGHGYGKLLKFFGEEQIKFYDAFGLGAVVSLSFAVLSEFFASLLIVFGIFTRVSSLSLIVTMAVAAFMVHADDPFARKEKAILFLLSYILLFFTGPGKYSFSGVLQNRFKFMKKYIWG